MMWWPGPNCPLYRPRKSSGTDASLTPIKRNQPVTFSLQSWKKMKFYCLNNWRIIPQLSCCSNALPRSLSLVLHYHSPITEAAAAVAKSLQLCPTLCDPTDCSTPGFPVHHQLLELAQNHVHRVSDAIYHLIFCCPLLLLPSIFPSISIFSNESVLRIRWLKYWTFT